MLAESQNYLREHHREAQLYVYGQDYNKQAFAIAASDMLIKQVDHNGTGENIRFGDSLIDDQFRGERFDYLLANPPFGVDWKRQQKEIQREHEKLGFGGRFGAGLPRVNDGALLFLQHMLSKFEPVAPERHQHGSRLAIVFNGSPLFTGGAGNGESNIRKWIIENDWLEGIIALPEQMFYNTGIGTYIWIVTNRKERRRRARFSFSTAASSGSLASQPG
jgi:type I restriction enzyme M protein